MENHQKFLDEIFLVASATGNVLKSKGYERSHAKLGHKIILFSLKNRQYKVSSAISLNVVGILT